MTICLALLIQNPETSAFVFCKLTLNSEILFLFLATKHVQLVVELRKYASSKYLSFFPCKYDVMVNSTERRI